MKRPSFQFYPGDWLRDTALQTCSLAARGLWVELLCRMHDGQPYGHLAVNGEPISDRNAAKMLSVSLTKWCRLVTELETKGVASRSQNGALFSRRMVRDEEVRQRRAAGGYESIGHPNVPPPKHRPEGTHQGPAEGRDAVPPPAVAVAVASASATELQQPAKASPSGGARSRQHSGDVSRADLMGRIRKACAPRHGKVSEDDMRCNADIADRLAQSYTYAELAQAIAGRRSRIDLGQIPSMPAGCGWTLKVYWDKDPIRNQINQDIDAHYAAPPPGPSSEEKRGGTAKVSELMDFTKFAKRS